MNLEFILASGNAHKAEEFDDLFSSSAMTSSLCSLTIKKAPKKRDVEEDGKTFSENALKKAKAYYESLRVPVMADDSGLIIPSLPGELGIHTARFGGEGLNSFQRNKKLLERMEEMKGDKRKAYFICVLCFYLNEEEVFFFEGRMMGEISMQPQGEKGFGYDPIFIPQNAPEKNKTAAELYEWKQQNGHRALACRYAQKFFGERVGQI